MLMEALDYADVVMLLKLFKLPKLSNFFQKSFVEYILLSAVSDLGLKSLCSFSASPFAFSKPYAI